MSECNIVLTGFMGTGKSTVGVLLAKRLKRVFIDMDTAIEHRTGLTIPHIFAAYGEPTFRAIEKGIAHELVLRGNLVIATGGGTMLDADTRRIMCEHTFLICLTATQEVLNSRLSDAAGRPLAPKWPDLLAQRQPIYDSLPRHIDASNATPQQLAEEIENLWRNA